ncbi:Protein CBG20263 [Caenorhabditis briggsae]|uniref:Protein CBG20263 n=1 Tax=Caenorhabditis briggsae TaxID=6238 RepID=A8XXD8_CAEBR|nr:Protein CBG20263 [Caenorhabditis briggsae]CAP37327.1 Protein CBG20263 [Caenorhabditis briggsae]
MSSNSASIIAKSELGLTPFQVQKIRTRSRIDNQVRIQKCKMAFPGTHQNEHKRMMFGDKKLLTLKAEFLSENHRVFCSISELANNHEKLQHFECVAIILAHPV